MIHQIFSLDMAGQVLGFDNDAVDQYAEIAASPGLRKTPTKERITTRMSTNVLQQFQATGPGWKSRIDAALQDWLQSHQAR